MLAAGTKLGPYTIVAPIGAGGMGEVYRARDERLKRDVAIKVLPASFSSDPDRLRRFEQEAQAAGALNHPNITAVYDVGQHDGAPYVVQELLEGEPLRTSLIVGKLSQRRTVDYAVQIAHGLAAAHARGIVHRDLKPENLFITKDGRVKILDFGLAKLIQPDKGAENTQLSTETRGTEPGVVLGTLGYMSPEQVRGLPSDASSDLFSFGAILYEMLSGKRAFKGATAADTMSAILKEDPPEISETGGKPISPALERIVHHCLEKNPEQRAHSAHDLAFELETLSSVSAPTLPADKALFMRRRLRMGALAVAAVAGIAAAAFFAGKKEGYVPPPSFQQLTFRRGKVFSARFAPDGQTVYYTAAWDGQRMEIFSTRTDQPEPKSFGMPGAFLMAISGNGKMAVSLNRHSVWPFIDSGTLAETTVSGGVAPREVLEDVQWADWSTDGKELAIVRTIGQKSRLEYPVGHVLFETVGWLSHPRISPAGDLVAFLEHPIRNDDGGIVSVVDRSSKRTELTRSFFSEWGLAWSPSGREIWFCASELGMIRALYAVSLSRKARLLERIPTTLNLLDIARDGRILVSHDQQVAGILARAAGDEKERDLGWRTWSTVWDISDDGKKILLQEAGAGASPEYDLYVRALDGSPPLRVGVGSPLGLSPDGRWVLASVPRAENRLVLYPVGAGENRTPPIGKLAPEVAGDFLPDNKQFVFTASEAGRGLRIYLMDLDGGKPRPVSPEGYRSFLRGVSPDGKVVAAIGPDGKQCLYPLQGGEPRDIPGLSADETPLGWSTDGRYLFVYRPSDLPARVHKLDVATGRRELWKELMPADPAGIELTGNNFNVAPDGSAYAYEYMRTLSTLYVVEGLR